MALKSILVKRKEKSLPSNRLACGVCKQRFWMTCKYLDHMSNHKHFLFSCNICNKGYYDQKQLDEHYITHKEVVNTYDCNQCTRKFLQSYQLEQHMQFHMCPSSSIESYTKQKKTVHFNNILESRDIDNDFSDDDYDFYENCRRSNKIRKTRSGRIVKVKKLFEDEPELKRRRKSSNILFTKALGNTGKAEQPLRLEGANEESVVTEKLSSTSPSPADSSMSSKNIISKKLVIITEKMPEHVYESYIAKGNVITHETSKSQMSSNRNCSVHSHSQTKSSITGSIENDSKGSKVISKISSSVNYSNSDELPRYLNQNNFLYDNSLASSISLSSQSAGTANLGCDNVTIISEKSDCVEKIIGPNLNPSSKSDQTSIKNSNAFSTDSIKQLPKIMQNPSPPAKKMNAITDKPFLTSSTSNQVITSSYIHTSPRVDKQFLYVGPKQDISKIKTIIEEMKTMSNPSIQSSDGKSVVKTNSCRFSQNICNKSPEKAKNLNVGNSDISMNAGSLREKSNGNELNELESTDGILGKKVVKDFILIKVTPELMQKMQRKTLVSQQIKHENLESFSIVKSECYPANTLPQSSTLNIDLKVTPDIIKQSDKNSTVEVKDAQISPKIFTCDSNSADKAVKTHIEISQSLKSTEMGSLHKVTSINTINETKKIPEQKSKFDNLNDKEYTQTVSYKSEHVNYTNKKEKLLDLYNAKVEEKERKKREKYDFKKKMRYMEKILSINNPNITLSTKKKSKLSNPAVFNKCNKVMLVMTETDNNKSTITDITKFNSTKNLVENAELTLKSNKNLFTKKICKSKSESKDLFSTSQVLDEAFSIDGPQTTKECGKSSRKCAVASSYSVDFHVDKLIAHQKFKSNQHKFTEKEAVQKAYEISLKFEKTLSEKECVNLLDELDNLITSFNISKKCPFLFPIIRFCRLYVESYKVKERANLLHTKLVKAST